LFKLFIFKFLHHVKLTILINYYHLKFNSFYKILHKDFQDDYFSFLGKIIYFVKYFKSFGVFKSLKIYISRGDSSLEQLIATRDNIASTIGGSIMLDADTTILLDEFIKESTVRIRLEYVKRDVTTADITIKASMDFNAAPNTSK
jgi:hypothetical protein